MLLSSTGLWLLNGIMYQNDPVVFKFIRNCTKKNDAYTKYMHQILDLSLPAYEELFDEIDTENLVVSNGIMYIWNNKNLSVESLK